MPILADSILEPIGYDIDRYNNILDSQTCAYRGGITLGGVFYTAVEICDTEINGLENCRLLLLYSIDEGIVYSCYFKHVMTKTFGHRVVQVEVRCTVPGLARAAMSEYFMRHYDSLRTDISNTPAGRKMWERFISQDGFNFYLSDLTIDLRNEQGAHNQDAYQPEIYQNLRHYNADEQIWHDNRKGDVIVVYATNEKLL